MIQLYQLTMLIRIKMKINSKSEPIFMSASVFLIHKDLALIGFSYNICIYQKDLEHK